MTNNTQLKKALTITQIICLLDALFLPLVNGMFTWRTYNMKQNLSNRGMSLNNLMTTQEICGGSFVYWIFNIAAVAMIIYCVIELFFEDKVQGHKSIIALPAINCLFGLIMIIGCSNHTDRFNWNGEIRYVAVMANILAYIEIVILIAVVLIECYKQFKCKT